MTTSWFSRPLQHAKGQFPYRYDALRTDQFRLVTIIPDDSDSDIHLTMRHACIDEPNFYYAVSYVWGSQVDQKHVYVNNKYMRVTTSLLGLLKRLRTTLARAYRSLTVWVDAICINQRDDQEKNTQISLMPKIYPGSFQVICYLGEDYDNSALTAFAALRRWHEVYDKSAEQRLAEKYAVSSQQHSKDETHEEIAALRSLFDRSYFKRAWILQEPCQASYDEPSVIVGDHHMSWRVFHSACLRLFANTDSALLFGTAVNFIMPILRCYEPSRNNARLSTLIPASFPRYCADPRDLVFSLHGIAARNGFHYPTPDYRWTVVEAFVAYTRAAIQVDGSLDILFHSAHRQANEPFPSWSIKPYRQEGDLPLMSARATPGYRYRSTLSTVPDVQIGSLTGVTLGLRGFDIDRIAQIYSPKSLLEDLDNASNSWQDLNKKVAAYARSLDIPDSYLRTREPRHVALLRTLLADRFIVDRKVPLDNLNLETVRKRLYSRCRTMAASFGKTSVVDSSAAGKRDQSAENYDIKDSTGSRTESYTHVTRDMENLFGYLEERFDFRQDVTQVFPHDAADESSWHRWLEQEIMRELTSRIRLFCRESEDRPHSRTLARTTEGLLCLAPPETKVGDRIVGLFGGSTPFVLRRVRTDKYELMGDIYVHGLMDGEAMQNLDLTVDGELFTLV